MLLKAIFETSRTKWFEDLPDFDAFGLYIELRISLKFHIEWSKHKKHFMPEPRSHVNSHILWSISLEVEL